MSETASISTGIASRYATAVFDLATEDKALDALEADLAMLEAALADSEDLRDLIASPIYTRDDMQAGIAAVASAMGLSAIMSNTLKLMATKRRLFVVPQMIAALREKIADHKGEVTADVVSAKALTKTQSDKLAKALKSGELALQGHKDGIGRTKRVERQQTKRGRTVDKTDVMSSMISQGRAQAP